MAKKLESGQEPTAAAIRLMPEQAVKNFHKDAQVLENRKTKVSEDISEHYADGRKKHLERKAYKLLEWCLKIATKKPDAVASFLASFDHYRETFKIDEMVNLQGRLFPDKANAEASEDEKDLRPRHLRTGSSDPQAAVRDLAGGDQKPPLDSIGRGKPN